MNAQLVQSVRMPSQTHRSAAGSESVAAKKMRRRTVVVRIEYSEYLAMKHFCLDHNISMQTLCKGGMITEMKRLERLPVPTRRKPLG